jgi:uncharacterized protein (DUF1697 family)
MPQYVALLRGINSGKNPTIKMEVLRRAFQELGFEKVKTILASGNVLFETEATADKALEERIAAVLPKTLGFQSDVIVRTIPDLQRLVESNPFQNIPITPHTRPYVTFVQERKTGLTFPTNGKGYTILGIFEGAVCSVVDLAGAKTPDLMQVLDKELGKNITTRSWNTVKRIVKAATRG